MKRVSFLLLMVVFAGTASAQFDESFYFGSGVRIDGDIPYPGYYSGHEFGKWHFSHDQLIHYLNNLADQSKRVSIQEYGRTHENRPLYLLSITSPENQRKLDTIRKRHLEYIYGENKQDTNQEMPMIVWLGYSVHGDEPSAGNASMLTAYYLAASEDPEVRNILENTVILIDPCLNPDGFNRAAQWSNMHIHNTPGKNLRDRQYRQDWPGGRTNHYWFDLNRDWLPAQHPESKSRLEVFHAWKPHVLTDHHEMGSRSTFFFQPGVPERVNPNTPEENTLLTTKLSKYHAEALDEIGTLYFSEESFDDFYYGKGSSYPDVNGGIGILFEQAGMLGQKLDLPGGVRTFADAIKNHFTVSISTIRGTLDNRKELNNYQRNFFDISDEVEQDSVKGYVFGSKHVPVKTFHFLELLDDHQIEVHKLKQPHEGEKNQYDRDYSYVVPLEQKQYRLVRSLFEKRTTFEDSIFYDVSTWTMPLAFDLPYDELKTASEVKRLIGERVKSPAFPKGEIMGGRSNIGYVVRGTYYNIHDIIYQLQKEDILVQVATRPFSLKLNGKLHDFNPGSIFVPSGGQDTDDEKVFQSVQKMVREKGIKALALTSGLNPKGIDLGSRNFIPLNKPKILIAAGEGTNSYATGEIWHLLDERFNIPSVLIKPDHLEHISLADFNTLILPDGYYQWSDAVKDKIDHWLKNGGLIVASEDANRWLDRKDLIKMDRKQASRPDSAIRLPYIERRDRRGAQSVNGVILNASVDHTNPVCYGVTSEYMPVLRSNKLICKKTGDPYSTPVMIEEDPLLSGYLSDENQKMLEHSVWCQVYNRGNGNIISFFDDPNFRAFWYGTNKLFLNAVFYGSILN
ncbi:MAG: M14 family zinc carboxypeptidase [Bacteroidales bacterium]